MAPLQRRVKKYGDRTRQTAEEGSESKQRRLVEWPYYYVGILVSRLIAYVAVWEQSFMCAMISQLTNTNIRLTTPIQLFVRRKGKKNKKARSRLLPSFVYEIIAIAVACAVPLHIFIIWQGSMPSILYNRGFTNLREYSNYIYPQYVAHAPYICFQL